MTRDKKAVRSAYPVCPATPRRGGNDEDEEGRGVITYA